MSDWVLLDIFLRGAGASLLIASAMMFALRRPNRMKSLSVSVGALTLCAYVLSSSPLLPFQGTLGMSILNILAAAAPVAIYWAGLELFLDRTRFQTWQFVLGGATILSLPLGTIWDPFCTLHAVLCFILYAHLCFVALLGGPGDLIEKRCRCRHVIASLVGVYCLGLSVVEIFNLPDNMPPAYFAVQALVMFVFFMIFLLWSAKVVPDLWVEEDSKPVKSSEMPMADRAVLERIQQAMREGVWREEGLSIAQLAARVDAPEHRVRRVINQGLGHRNFARFINAARVEAAQDILSDRTRADTPVLSIAFEVGFASLGPFNRAFRQLTGQSPTEFRRAQAAT